MVFYFPTKNSGLYHILALPLPKQFTQQVMYNTKIEKSTRTIRHTIFPEYRMRTLSGSTDAFQVVPIKYFFQEHPECLLEEYVYTHDFNLIVWVKEGRGLFCVDFENFEIEEDTIFFLSSRSIHHYQPFNEQNGCAIAVSPEFMQHVDPAITDFLTYTLFGRTNMVKCCKVPSEVVAKLQNFVESMMQESRSAGGNHLYRSCLASYLTLFVATAIRECRWDNVKHNLSDRQTYKHYISFLKYVEENFATSRSIHDYSAKVGVSPFLLAKCTQMYEGCTPLHIINARIILEAKRMLRFTSLRIKEIAFRLGFTDPSYFNKFFKKVVKMTPAEFRGTEQP